MQHSLSKSYKKGLKKWHVMKLVELPLIHNNLLQTNFEFKCNAKNEMQLELANI